MKMVKVNKIGYIFSKVVLKSIVYSSVEVKVIGEVKDIEGVISMDMIEIKKKIMIGNLIMDIKEM